VQTLHDYELVSASPLDDDARALDHHEARPSYRALNAFLHQVRQHVHVPRVTQWTACSRFVAERYSAKGIEAVPIPNFVDASVVPTDHDPFRRDGMVFCGRLSPEKGVEDILEMAHELTEHRVTIVGGGDLAPLVAEAAASLPNLTYLGHLNSTSLMDLVRSARLVAIPSRWAEPGALITLEAMSVGTPVVVYRNGGLTEYVMDAGGGRVVDPDVRQLISACRLLHDDVSEWTRCSRAGADAMSRRHSPEAFVTTLETVYEQALSSGGGPHDNVA
jgi:glycosyltransferase involved in cell wall biosynthesis